MRIYQCNNGNQIEIYPTNEPQYVENIPMQVQSKGKFNFRSCSIRYYKGIPWITVSSRMQISGNKAKEIIKCINGYSRKQVHFN